MAGPGGGPPRKSHTKSRTGCKTCKRRHIRCDETVPQCTNCTKHNCRCDYMDSPPPLQESSQSSKGPNLLWSAQIENEIEAWHRTGIFPFPELGLHHAEQFFILSSIDLRLVHHLSSIYRDLQRIDFIHCTLWASEIPNFLDAALGYDFVMSAILAFSATHIAWQTNNTETKNLAYYHRGVALKGLHGAIDNFSSANSDAILAASILLSWQAADWGGWTSLMRGVATVIVSMSPWKHESRFAAFIENNPRFFAGSSMQPTSLAFDQESLIIAADALQRLRAIPPKSPGLYRCLAEISEFTQEIQAYGATMRSEQIFEKLQPLRAWLFWLPVALVHAERIDDADLVLLAQLYTVALAVDSSFPELGGASLGSLTGNAIEQIDNKLRYRQSSRLSRNQNPAELDELMHCSRMMLAKFRLESAQRQEAPQMQLHGSPQSPYGFQHLNLGSQPGTPGLAPSTPGWAPGTPAGYPSGLPGSFSLMPNYSLEDLSVPASPFLQYSAPASRRHSGLIEPRLDELSFDNQSLSAFSFGGDSPAYSPGFVDQDQYFQYRGHSPGYQ